jgi:hypothetical protein
MQKSLRSFQYHKITLPPPKILAVRSWFYRFSPCLLRFFQPAIQPCSFML